jgi:glycosyltransferase involved in cell wall biosynthesis
VDTREIVLRRTIPVVINAFNVFTYVRDMVDKLNDFGFSNIVIVDNGSTYPDLLEYYREQAIKKRCLVLFYNENRGPRYFHLSGLFNILGTVPHFYTDPDCDFDYLSDIFAQRMIDLSVKYQCAKIGCALTLPTRENAIETLMPIFDEFSTYESTFWQKPLESLVYEALVDTTFHLFNPNYFTLGSTDYLKAIRVAEPGFCCTHLPWFKFDPISETERNYYIGTGSAWSHVMPVGK